MSNVHVFAAPNHSLVYPTVHRIGVHDVRDALREGFDDFLNNPSHLVFLGFIYPTVGLCLAFWTSNLNLLPLLYPLISGFALTGPFAAIGIYEMSRRREAGLDASWRHAREPLSECLGQGSWWISIEPRYARQWLLQLRQVGANRSQNCVAAAHVLLRAARPHAHR